MKLFRNILMILGFTGILAMPYFFDRIGSRLGISLSGVTEAAAAPQFTSEALMDGSLQSELDSYVTEELPGRDVMIKVRNQSIFSAFEKS